MTPAAVRARTTSWCRASRETSTWCSRASWRTSAPGVAEGVQFFPGEAAHAGHGDFSCSRASGVIRSPVQHQRSYEGHRDVEDWDAPFASATIVYGYESTGRRHGTIAKECAQCGGIFWPAYGNAVTCSVGCSKIRHRQTSRIDSADESGIEPRIRDKTAAPIRDITTDLPAFLKLVRDDPGRAQMIAPGRYFFATPASTYARPGGTTGTSCQPPRQFCA